MRPFGRGTGRAATTATALLLVLTLLEGRSFSCHAFALQHATKPSSVADNAARTALGVRSDPMGSSGRQDAAEGSSSSAPPDPFRLGYLSDVEGHWDYFLECVERSSVVEWEEADVPPLPSASCDDVQFRRLILVGPDSHFIYGGDAVDKGPGDIRLVRALVSLKKRYPDRVHLLVGNRDLNKLRLSSELSDADMARPIEEIGGPFWDRSAPTLGEYLERLKVERGAERIEAVNTRAERLRYMLKHTLGCPDTFEFRREEVGVLKRLYGKYPPKPETHDATPIHSRRCDGDEISIETTDEELVDSFLYEVDDPEGSLHQYLQLASIAAIVGNTIFVHGAIDRMTAKFVPALDTKFQVPTTPPPRFDAPQESTPTDGRIVENVHEWSEALNEYLRHGFQDYVDRREWNAERNARGGESLLAIQNRPSMWGRSVVCNSYADGGVISTAEAEVDRKKAMLAAQHQLDALAFEGIASNVMDPVPAAWLLDHGIQRIVVGHKPTGDCPAILNPKYTGVEVVSVDTSYARRRDLGNDNSPQFGNSRGDAVAIVEIAGKDAWNNSLFMSGTLACGTEYSNRCATLGTSAVGNGEPEVGDPYIGSKLPSGWWVKAAVPPNYHLCRGYGRSIEYDVCPIAEVREMLDEKKLQT